MRNRTVLTIFTLILGVAMGFAANKFTLVIDAGHGGHDSGAKGEVSQEKDINLKVALAFGKYVERNCNDVKVVYTRKTDVFVPLKQRANIANKSNADLFISVHTNALPNGRIARGFEVYTLGMHRAKDNLDVAMRENSVIEEEENYKQTYQGFDPKSSESYIMFEFMQSANMQKSVALAKLIENSVCTTADRVNMGVHQAGFLVLRETSMPSCLIELGFITTPDEEQFLNTDDGIDKLANGIYKAFLEYKKSYHGKVVVDTRPAPATTRQAPASARQQTAQRQQTVNPANNQRTQTTTPPARQNKPATTAARQTTPVNNTPATTRRTTPTTTKLPVFKVQIFAVAKKLEKNDPLFKGHTDVSSFTEGGHLIKYTIGSSTDYETIRTLRDTLKGDFPQAYIVAFKDGKNVNLSQAINEYKNYKRQQTHKR